MKPTMKKIFWNSEEGRARTGWRILVFLAIFYGLAFTVFLIRPLLGEMTRREFMDGYILLIVGVLAAAATIAVYVARRFFDKKSIISLGLQRDRHTVKDLIFGFLLSGMIALAFTLILVAGGWLEYSHVNWNGFLAEGASNLPAMIATMSLVALLLLLLETILVGYWEELVFRGYLLQNMMQGLGAPIAIILSCIIYGIVHSANPNATMLSTAIIVLFGYMRIYGYLSSSQLWLSMGMHIGWNFFQGPVFGFAASGHSSATLLQHQRVGPDWLTGGEFGPEGSILIIPLLGVAILTMKWWTRGREKVPVLKAKAVS